MDLRDSLCLNQGWLILAVRKFPWGVAPIRQGLREPEVLQNPYLRASVVTGFIWLFLAPDLGQESLTERLMQCPVS